MSFLDVNIACAHCGFARSAAEFGISNEVAIVINEHTDAIALVCRECVQSGFTVQSILQQLHEVEEENSTLRVMMQDAVPFLDGLKAQKKVMCDESMFQVLQSIIGYLPAEDVCRASSVCRYWNEVANTTHIWKCLCAQVHVPLEGVDQQTDGYAYKALFVNYIPVRRWLSGEGATITETQLIHPDGNPFEGDCWAISSRHLFLGSGQSIYVFCAGTGQYMHQLVGHTTDIWHLILSSNELIAVTRPASPGTDVRVWDVTTGQCLHTLVHPADYIGRIFLLDNLLVCSMINNRANNVSSMCVSNIETGDRLFEHPEWVHTCASDGGYMAISVDRFIRLLDTNTWTFMLTVPCPAMGMNGKIMINHSMRTLVAMGSHDLIWWDSDSGSVKAAYNNVHANSSMTTHADKMYLLRSSNSGRQSVTVYDQASGAVLHTIQGSRTSEFWGSYHPLSMLANGLLVVQGDEYVGIWDTNRMVHARDIQPHQGDIQWCHRATETQLQYVVNNDDSLTYFIHNFDA